MKYDRGLAEIFAMETDKHARETERSADKVVAVSCVGIVFLLFYLGVV